MKDRVALIELKDLNKKFLCVWELLPIKTKRLRNPALGLLLFLVFLHKYYFKRIH